MDRQTFFSDFNRSKIICILRNVPAEKVIPVSEALYRGGIRFLEVAFHMSSSLALTETACTIQKLRDFWGDSYHIGAGTVLTVEQADAARDAGAEYIFSPNTETDIIKHTKKLGLISIPGAFTPSEILASHNAGADIVKIFPASALSPQYIKELTAPFPHIPVIAVGGIHEGNLTAFLKAGCIGAGIGSALLNHETLDSSDYGVLYKKASAYAAMIRIFQEQTGA